MFVTKQDSIVKNLSDLSLNLKESQNSSEVSNIHPKHMSEEERISRETMNCSLKEISKNTLKSQKKEEEIFELLTQCHSTLVDINANGLIINNNQVLGIHSKLLLFSLFETISQKNLFLINIEFRLSLILFSIFSYFKSFNQNIRVFTQSIRL